LKYKVGRGKDKEEERRKGGGNEEKEEERMKRDKKGWKRKRKGRRRKTMRKGEKGRGKEEEERRKRRRMHVFEYNPAMVEKSHCCNRLCLIHLHLFEGTCLPSNPVWFVYICFWIHLFGILGC
jgi:hypothetical protein